MVIAKVKVVVLTGTRDGATAWEGHMGKGFSVLAGCVLGLDNRA